MLKVVQPFIAQPVLADDDRYETGLEGHEVAAVGLHDQEGAKRPRNHDNQVESTVHHKDRHNSEDGVYQLQHGLCPGKVGNHNEDLERDAGHDSPYHDHLHIMDGADNPEVEEGLVGVAVGHESLLSNLRSKQTNGDRDEDSLNQRNDLGRELECNFKNNSSSLQARDDQQQHIEEGKYWVVSRDGYRADVVLDIERGAAQMFDCQSDTVVRVSLLVQDCEMHDESTSEGVQPVVALERLEDLGGIQVIACSGRGAGQVDKEGGARVLAVAAIHHVLLFLP